MIKFIDYLPSLDRLLITGGAVAGAAAWALGGYDLSIQWLAIFVLVDYITGNAIALKTGQWSSSIGFKGLIKKVVIFGVVALCNGLDQVTGAGFIRTAGISAFCLNEAGSIIENLDRGGLASYIPAFIRASIKQLREKSEKQITEKLEIEDNKHD